MYRLILAVVAVLFGLLLYCLDSAQAQQPTVSCATNASRTSAVCELPPIVSLVAEATHIVKNVPATLFTAYATNLTATGGFLVILNAAAVPADGAILPIDCVPLPANNSAGSCGPGCTGVNYRPGPGRSYSVGIVAVVTSAATCFTKTTGVITAFMSVDVE